MIATAPAEKISTRIEGSLRELRRNNVRRGAIYSATVATACFCALLVVAIGVDWYFGWLASSTRWLISLSACAATAVAFATLLLWVLRSRRQQNELAEQADEAAPVFEERIQTIVTIEGSDRIAADRQMMSEVLAETESLYARIDPAHITHPYRFKPPLAVIAVCLGLLVVLLMIQTRSTAVLVSRFLWPSTSLTRTVLDGNFGDHVIGEDESWELSGKLEGQIVSSVLLEQRIDESQTVLRTLQPGGKEGNAVEFKLTRAKQSFDYRVTAGDYRSDWQSVTVARRPRIVGAQLQITPPEYTGHKETRVTKIPRKLAVIEGSTITLSIRAEGEVDRAEWLLEPDQGTRSMYLDEDGFYRCSLLINQSVKLSPRLVEPHGLENLNRFEIEVRALKDKPPTVEIIKPSPDTAVRPDDTIQIEFDARDDVGISHAEVVLYKTNEQTGETTPLKTITVPVDQQRNRKRLEASVDIDLSELDLEHGETINYRVDVYDQKQLDGSPATSTENRGSPDDAQSLGGERSPDGSLRPADGDAERQSANNDGGTQTATDSDETQASTAAGESAKTAGDSQSDSESNQDSPNGNSRSGDSASENAQSGDASRGGSSGDQSAESKPSEGNTEDGDPTSAEEDDTATEENSSSSDEQSMTVDDSQPKDSAGEPTETADSGNGNDNNDESRRENESLSESAEGDAAEKQASESSPNNSFGGNASNDSQSDQQNSSSNSSTSSDSKPSDQQLPPDGGRRPSMRSLDAVKPTSSGEMKLKIDEYAGSFEGESRRKLEIAIDPVLQNLRKWLSACEDLLASAGKNSAETPAWDEGKQQSLSRAIGYLQQSNNAVEALNRKTKGTPYAFVGLQIADIALTHFDPATSDALAALKTESAGRYTLIDSARGQVQRALVRLNELTEKYEREKRDQLLAERIRDFQKMYRVYIEDTLARLQAERERINSIKRKGVEFDLDEEYLARLKEVLEMRRDLEAELARILSEDPRLLKRFSQSSRSNADTLRDQFTLLARRQSKLTELAGELRSSSDTETGDPPVGQPLGQLEL